MGCYDKTYRSCNYDTWCNSGLVLPPRVAPVQVDIIPIMQKKEGVLDKAFEVMDTLKAAGLRVKVDDSDKNPGWKFSEQEMRGIPVRVEMGPRDIEAGQAIVVRRDTREKITVNISELADKIKEILDAMQVEMLERARKHRDEHTYVATNYDEFKDIVANKPGFVKAMCAVTRHVRIRLRKIQLLLQDVCHLHRNIFQMYVYAAESRQRRWFTGVKHTKRLLI